ncbi:MAG: hypothetical protein JSW38_02890 [Dehalococcoidia bacterium]|nr:MAG: hypothetical protein JSW38_02890 [Dehalococcoidia bacterium]
MNYIYTHLPQDEDIGFLERSYSVIEGTLEYDGREVLYLLVDASDVTFCDRSHASHLASVNVKGYVVRLKYEMSEAGEAMSEIEPIVAEGDKKAITDILRARHNISAVNFF